MIGRSIVVLNSFKRYSMHRVFNLAIDIEKEDWAVISDSLNAVAGRNYIMLLIIGAEYM